MIKGKTLLALAGLAAAALTSGVAVAAETGWHPSLIDHPAVELADQTPALPATPVFLESDPAGTVIDLRISRNQIMYEISWSGATPATVRMQGAGTSLNMLPGALPSTINAVEGVIAVPSGRVLATLATNPGRFSVQAGETAPFKRVGAVDFNRILHVGQLAAVASGDQESTPGDVGAHAAVFLGTGTGTGTATINFAAVWTGLTSPTALNVNQGATGAIGNNAAMLFQAPQGLNPTIVAVAGTAPATPASIAAVKANPAAFHVNLLTTRFPGGAVRGQLFLAAGSAATMPTTTMPTMPMPTTTAPKPTMTAPRPTMTAPMPTMTKPAPTTSPAMPMPTLTATAGAPPHW